MSHLYLPTKKQNINDAHIFFIYCKNIFLYSDMTGIRVSTHIKIQEQCVGYYGKTSFTVSS